MVTYTYTFEQEYARRFREVLSNMDPADYNIITDFHLVEDEKRDRREWMMSAVIEMDPDACLTIRLGMKHVVIRRARTDEELAAEKALDDKNTVRITVKVDGLPGPATP